MTRRMWRRLLRFLFRLLYNEFAWAYDGVAWAVSLGQWRTWGCQALPHLRGARILELAHGPGHTLAAMVQQGLAPVGLDLSPHMGRLARRRLLETGIASVPEGELAAPLLRGRAQALPFRGACFDSVLATFPTEFIVDPATLRETARVLRPGGRLFVVVEARLKGHDLLSRLIEGLYVITGQRQGFLDEVERAMTQAGFAPTIVRERAGRSEVMIVTGNPIT
ncbi:MAG TPA: methyltransferase domain-containing protein [Chloroflexi bacterium]|nr:methyltransferase domain-containing protein [Chloroflexota bacterium]